MFIKQIRKYYFPLLAICSGIVLSAIGFTAALQWEQKEVSAEFKEHAENHYAALKRELGSELHVISSVQAFFDHSSTIRQSEFRTFVRHYLFKHKSIQSLQWIPRIPDSLRESFESSASQEGVPAFRIIGRKSTGLLRRSGKHNEYSPAYYVEPRTENRLGPAYDLAASPQREEAMERACDTGEMTATSRLMPLQEKAEESGIIVFAPVYRYTSQTDSVSARRAGLRGFVLGAFRLDAIIEKSMTYLFPESMDMYLYDTSTSEKKDLLYYLRADKTKDAAMAGETAKIDSGLEYTNMLDLAGLKWLVLYKATPDYIASRATWRPWGILAIGLLLTCALAAYLVSNTRRAQQLQAFTKHLGNAREEERTALSRELHDQVGQSLTAIGINLNIVRSQMNANSPALATARLNESLKLVEEVTGSIRNFMTDLRSPVIDAYGLTAALRWYAEKFSLNTGIAVALHETEPISGLTTETANTLFRITQEALTNVAKHSQATRADIVVASDSGTIRLTISDNGNGFNAGRLQKTDTHGGWGLITMNERATSIQGRCRVVSQPGRGTRIEVEVPLGDY